MPKVSIITPAYNAEESIRDVYNSIASQTFTDWEWMVCDDCSKDKTYEILKEIASKDKRVKLLSTGVNSRAAKARNLATKNATGKFIAFLDADDMWKPEKLEKQIKFMEDNDYDMSYTYYDVKYQDGKIVPFTPKRDVSTYKIMLKRCDMGCLTIMYNAEKIGKIWMAEDCPNREDYAAWCDTLRKGVIAHKLPENLAIYSVGNPNAVTTDKVKIFKCHFHVYRHHLKFNWFKSVYYVFAFTFNKLIKGY